MFVDAMDEAMPATTVGWSWELECFDADDDGDLDVAVSCKSCAGSKLYDNDGTGAFVDASDARMPALPNNYEFETMDLDGDGDLDLVTINDHGPGTRGGIFENDGGVFTDATDLRWPMTENPAGDDNMVAFVDVDSDGDPDFVVAGLFGQPDRLMRNDGGIFSMDAAAFAPADSPGSLGIAVSDLDGDGRWDVVLAEGEAAFADRVFFGVDVPVDTAPPVISNVTIPEAVEAGIVPVRARIHDHKSPLEAHDLARAEVVVAPSDPGGGPAAATAMRWIGEYQFMASLQLPDGRYDVQICAEDRRGNERCTDPVPLQVGEPAGGTTGGATAGASSSGPGTTGAGPDASGGTSTSGAEDTDPGAAASGGGCGCRTAARKGPAVLAVFLLVARRRRGRRRRPVANRGPAA